MLTVAQRPLFQVVLNDGDQWSVEAEWPDGTIEQINTFKHHYQAVDWLNAQSERCLRERKD